MSNPYGPPGGYRPPGYGQQPYPAQWQRPPQYPQQGYAPYPQAPRPVQRPPDPDRARRVVGLLLWILAMAAGVILNLSFSSSRSPPPGGRRRCSPPWRRARCSRWSPSASTSSSPRCWTATTRSRGGAWRMAFLWGAVVATGFAGFINTVVDLAASALLGRQGGRHHHDGDQRAARPRSSSRGWPILGVFYFLRREFDGVVDGIIYATFCALGFAAVENISYYARAEMHRPARGDLLRARDPRALGAPALHVDDRHRLRHLARVDPHRRALGRARWAATSWA